MNDEFERIAVKVSRDCIIGNVLLTAFKFFAGFYAHSAAMVSDAVHSLSDILGSFIVIIGVKLANKKSDKEHLYGHERMECVAAIVLAAILFVIGTAIGYPGVKKIIFGTPEELVIPGFLALVAAVTSIVLKEAMFRYTRTAAKKIDSAALMAEAWHHRSDALSSVGSFAGILGARLGFPILDPVASVVICLFILKVAADIFMNAVTENFENVYNIAIQPKTLEVSFNIIPNTAYVVWSIVFIGVIPMAVMIFGFVFWLRRRKL